MLTLPSAFTVDYCNALHVRSDNVDQVLQCQSSRPQRLPVAACVSAGRSPPPPPEVPDYVLDLYKYAGFPFVNLPGGFDGSRMCGKSLEVPLKRRAGVGCGRSVSQCRTHRKHQHQQVTNAEPLRPRNIKTFESIFVCIRALFENPAVVVLLR